MSYTTFEYSNLKNNETASTADQSLTLSFDLRNTGQMAADQIAQNYLSPTTADHPIRPIQLQGFARVTLQPGETKPLREYYLSNSSCDQLSTSNFQP